MQKRILEGIACLGLLAVLPACSARKQSATEEVYTVAHAVQAGYRCVAPVLRQGATAGTRSFRTVNAKHYNTSVTDRRPVGLQPDDQLYYAG